MKTWWMNNRWGALALIVLMPLTTWLVFANGWFRYFESRPSQPIAVAAGDTIEFAGSQFRVESAERDASAVDLPAGTQLVTAQLRVEPSAAAGEGLPCAIDLVRPDGSGEWDGVLRLEFGWEPPIESTLSACDSAKTEPYTIELAYLVPVQDAANLALRVVIAEELPSFFGLRCR